ncbi:thrombomodulin-like [Polymixia lowei]
MKDVIRICSIVLTFLIARAEGVAPNNGYCIGNQCFAVFQDVTDFTMAQNRCRKHDGHLMTVRSSVSHDTLLLLLGGILGQFWVGLHLLSGCPDAHTDLRGFQWVTGDSQSDFYNWAVFHNSCSPQCVLVSKYDDFRWNPESCSKQAAGFLCEYNFKNPCKRLDVERDEIVKYTVVYGFEGDDVRELPQGSVAVRRPSEATYICFAGQWMKAPWNCEINNGGCEYKCVEDAQHAPVCVCPTGHDVNPDNNVTCEVIKHDPCASLRCEQACYHHNDSYTCTCEHGFELAADGRTCRDVNNCIDSRQCPGDNYRCVNTVGGFQCVCKRGYRSVGGDCVDVDECADAPCEHTCENKPGGYECSCFDGYRVIPNTPNKCELHCGREECRAECDPNDELECHCPAGYVADQRQDKVFCVDINECVMDYCDQGCKNTYGGYVCSCSDGYTLVGQYKCVKDEVDTEWEGSGATTPYVFVTPSVKYPEPTRRPAAVTAGGLLGIIVCIVVLVLVMVFLAHYILRRRGKMESASTHKAQGEEHVTMETCEKQRED